MMWKEDLYPFTLRVKPLFQGFLRHNFRNGETDILDAQHTCTSLGFFCWWFLFCFVFQIIRILSTACITSLWWISKMLLLETQCTFVPLVWLKVWLNSKLSCLQGKRLRKTKSKLLLLFIHILFLASLKKYSETTKKKKI